MTPSAPPDDRNDPAIPQGIPLTILTGFLGAGKTTLLGRLLRHPALSDAAVIINEFGEISLDHDLVERSDETLIELRGGCLCCTVRTDLIDTVRQLLERRRTGEIPPFTRLLVETTGLADPVPVLQTATVEPLLAYACRLTGVITLVDAVLGDATLDRHEEAVKQVAVADTLVISKTDQVKDPASRRDLDALRARLTRLNPGARVVTTDEAVEQVADLLTRSTPDGAASAEGVADWLRADAFPSARAAGHGHDHHAGGHDHHHHDVNRHDDRIRAFCLTYQRPISTTAFNLLMQLLIEERGADLLRFKAILNVREHPETPAILQVVQHVVSPIQWLDRWPSTDRRSRLVFIARDLDPERIAYTFSAIQTEVDRASG